MSSKKPSTRRVGRSKKIKVTKKKSRASAPSSISLRGGQVRQPRREDCFAPVSFDPSISHYFGERPFKEGKMLGTTLYGCVPLSTVQYNSLTGGLYPFIPIGAAAYRTVLSLSPLNLFLIGSPESTIASVFSKYMFTELELVYQGVTGTSSSSNVLIGYYSDGAVTDSDISTTVLFTSPGTMQVQTWNPVKRANVTSLLPRDDWFYMDLDTGSIDPGQDSSLRLSYQGAIMGVWYAIPPSDPSPVVGTLWVRYSVNMIGPRYPGNFAKKPALPSSHGIYAERLACSNAEKLREDKKSSARPSEILSPDEDLIDPKRSVPSIASRLKPASERSASTERKERIR
jgi:hypothetical protein